MTAIALILVAGIVVAQQADFPTRCTSLPCQKLVSTNDRPRTQSQTEADKLIAEAQTAMLALAYANAGQKEVACKLLNELLQRDARGEHFVEYWIAVVNEVLVERGEVYKAETLKLNQTVALKFLPENLAKNEGALNRYIGEVRTAWQVSHENVCRVFDIGDVNGERFLSMEFVDGDDCRALRPRTFTRYDENGYSYVWKQPENPDEEELCYLALIACPVEAIGDDV